MWRSFFFRVEREAGALDLTGDPDILDARYEPRASLPGLLTAPYHRGFVQWLTAGGGVRHVFDVWED